MKHMKKFCICPDNKTAAIQPYQWHVHTSSKQLWYLKLNNKSEKEQLSHNKIMEAEQKKMAKALVQSRGSDLYLKKEGKSLFLK